jgi:hypothetical protein
MSTDILVFSKDRACQLDLLLTSIEERGSSFGNVSVIYRSSDQKFSDAYDKCKSAHASVNFIEEVNFQNQVKSWLNDSKRSSTVMLSVDDDVLRDYVNFEEVSQILVNNPQIICYSPKLGLQLTQCYSLNQPQIVPNGNVINGYFLWEWRNAVHDWQYVFSVGGHVFRTAEIAAWVSSFNFSNPNNLEDSIQRIKNHFVVPSAAISHVVSKMINTPMNRVQNTHANRCGDISHIELNENYLEGRRLDPSSYYSIVPTACHENAPAVWRKS